MSGKIAYASHGSGTVRPYLYGNTSVRELIKTAFGATEIECVPNKSGFHIEAAIGDSMLVLEVVDPAPARATIGSVYVYVPDVDGAYARALAAGATSLDEPSDKPYDERSAGVQDSFGNTWWIATYTG